MKRLVRAIAVGVAVFLGVGALPAQAAPEDVVTIPDAAFAECITETLGLPAGSQVTEGQLAGITALDCGQRAEPVADLMGAQHLTGVTYLSFDDGSVSDLGPLSGLSTLTNLNLNANRVTNLQPLAGLTGLKRLQLNNNQVADVGPLAGLTSLEFVALSSNRIAAIGPLAGLTGLTDLYLSSNQVADVSPLAGLISLKYLGLGGNRIVSVGPLAGLTALVGLSLGLNQVFDVRPLAGLGGLTSLDLAGNRVADFSSLPAGVDASMSGQQLALTRATTGVRFPVVLRAADGTVPTLTLPAGVTFAGGGLTYSRAGTYSIPFQAAGTSFSGTINQTVVAAPATVVVTAYSAGTKPVGQASNVWGSATNAAGARVAVQALVRGAWSTSQIGTVAANGSYVLPLTYGSNSPGTYRFRVAVTTAAGTFHSAEFSFTRTATVVVTAYSAGTKPVGQASNVWGSASYAAGARVAVQALVRGAWSTSQIGTVAANWSYVLPLTYGSNTRGTYRFRVVVTTGAGTFLSPEFTFTRT